VPTFGLSCAHTMARPPVLARIARALLTDDPRLRHDLSQNDPELRPPQLKSYPDGLPVVELPRDLPDPGVSATSGLRGAFGLRASR